MASNHDFELTEKYKNNVWATEILKKQKLASKTHDSVSSQNNEDCTKLNDCDRGLFGQSPCLDDLILVMCLKCRKFTKREYLTSHIIGKHQLSLSEYLSSLHSSGPTYAKLHALKQSTSVKPRRTTAKKINDSVPDNIFLGPQAPVQRNPPDSVDSAYGSEVSNGTAALKRRPPSKMTKICKTKKSKCLPPEPVPEEVECDPTPSVPTLVPQQISSESDPVQTISNDCVRLPEEGVLDLSVSKHANSESSSSTHPPSSKESESPFLFSGNKQPVKSPSSSTVPPHSNSSTVESEQTFLGDKESSTTTSIPSSSSLVGDSYPEECVESEVEVLDCIYPKMSLHTLRHSGYGMSNSRNALQLRLAFKATLEKVAAIRLQRNSRKVKGEQQSAPTIPTNSNCDNSPSGHISKAPPRKHEQGSSEKRQSVIFYSPCHKKATEKCAPQSNTSSCKGDERKDIPAKVSPSQNGFASNHLSCRDFFLERRSAKRKQSLDSASLNSYFSKRPDNGIPLNGVIASFLSQGKSREERKCLKGLEQKEKMPLNNGY